MLVKDWMTPVEESCVSTDTVEHAMHVMIRTDATGLLIVDNGKIRGIFTEQDLLKRVMIHYKDTAVTPLSEVMTPNPRCAEASDDILRTFLRLFRSGYRHMPVVEKEIPIGMISTRSRHVADLLVIAEYYLSKNYKRTEVNRVLNLDFEDELLLYALNEYGTKAFKEFKAANNLKKLKDGLRDEFTHVYERRFHRE